MGIGYAGAFFGGVAALLSPCAAMLLPAFFAYAFGRSRATLAGRTLLFYLGLLLTLVPLGLGAGAVGGLLTTHRDTLTLIGGAVLIVFGLMQALGVPLPVPGVRDGATRDPRGAVGAVLLGATYGLAGACTGPLLGAVLTVAAVSGSPGYGAALLAVFGLGMVVPLFVLALIWQRVEPKRRWQPRRIAVGRFTTSWPGIVSGVLFIGIGVLFIVTDATASLGGILDATTQYRVESWLGDAGSAVPDFVAVAALAAIVGGIAVAMLRGRARR